MCPGQPGRGKIPAWPLTGPMNLVARATARAQARPARASPLVLLGTMECLPFWSVGRGNSVNFSGRNIEPQLKMPPNDTPSTLALENPVRCHAASTLPCCWEAALLNFTHSIHTLKTKKNKTTTSTTRSPSNKMNNFARSAPCSVAQCETRLADTQVRIPGWVLFLRSDTPVGKT